MQSTAEGHAKSGQSARKARRPSSAQLIQTPNAEHIGRELEGRADGEGPIDRKVDVHDVADMRVERTQDKCPENQEDILF